MPLGLQNSLHLQVAKVFGNLHLRRFEQLLKMTNAKRPLCEKIDNSESRFVAKTFVNADESFRTVR